MALLLTALQTVSLVSFYYTFSISLTFYNKWILTGYPFPLSITMIHLIVKFLLAWLVRKIWSCIRGSPPLVLSWGDYLKNIVPVAVFSALDIGLSNWSLLFITVSLYTMSKSTALIFILFFALLFRLEKFRLAVVGVVILIVAGLLMFTYKSTAFNLEGFILVLGASVITGLRWSCAQLTIQKEQLGLSNPVDTLFHLQPVMILVLLPIAIPVDGTNVGTSVLVFRASDWAEFGWSTAYILPAACMAFMLGVSEYLLVYHTSGLTLSVAGVLKEVLILTLSTLWWEEESLTPLNMVGIAVCVSGIALHVAIKAYYSRVEDEKESESKVREDTMELLPSAKNGRGFVAEYSDESDVVYEKQTNNINS
ncbi:solute carrier family 35 member C2-like [Halichondria panicea]|uniref:solute carrier family 35 member C2-like n=1 Tax=Halichondria panicea TaxID=6063 RepID=UPI00312B7565